MIDMSEIMNALSDKIKQRVNQKAQELVQNVVYDGMVEHVNLSQISYTIEKDSDSGYTIKLNLARLSEEEKELTNTIYYKNGLQRTR